MTNNTIILPLANLEGAHLAHLVDEFHALLQDPDSESDPGVRRLTPNAYPEDANASEEFASATRDDLLERRRHDAAVVRAALRSFSTEDHEFTEEKALAPVDIVIAAADLDAWLRTLNALRLVIAERLGVLADDDHHDDDARFGVYDWLGYRLEVLIESADELDTDPA